MFSLRLRQDAHLRHFVISDTGAAGWEVREELDSQIVRIVRYLDWHRVERARQEFERQILDLRARGWVEA